MAITIVVEDGAGVLNANSYVTIEEARKYAGDRGIELNADDDKVASFLIQSTDYLESFACKYQGKPTFATQPLQWPRSGVILNCEDWPDNAIPPQLKAAQSALAVIVNSGIPLLPTITREDYVIEETVGPITTKYGDEVTGLADGVGMIGRFTSVDALLAPLFGDCNTSPFSLRTRRV